jgi:hypothetical protein
VDIYSKFDVIVSGGGGAGREGRGVGCGEGGCAEGGLLCLGCFLALNLT